MNYIRFIWLLFVLLLPVSLCGCGWQAKHHGGLQGYDVPQVGLIQNPMYVPMSDREFLWNQLVDTVDNYFRIQREERVQLLGGVLTEGRIETLPRTGASMLEPWRDDSSPGYQRLYATLQSIRRRAVVRVMPQADGGYLVEVSVYEDLEDVAEPEFSTVSAESLRSDGTLRKPGHQTKPGEAITLGWIPLGRDVQLEQRILEELRGRLGVVIAR